MEKVTMKLTNGEEVELSISFQFLFKLKRTNRELYDEFNRCSLNKPDDIEDFIVPIYVAYLCENQEKETKYSFNEFCDLLEYDLYKLGQINSSLMTKSKSAIRTVASK